MPSRRVHAVISCKAEEAEDRGQLVHQGGHCDGFSSSWPAQTRHSVSSMCNTVISCTALHCKVPDPLSPGRCRRSALDGEFLVWSCGSCGKMALSDVVATCTPNTIPASECEIRPGCSHLEARATRGWSMAQAESRWTAESGSGPSATLERVLICWCFGWCLPVLSGLVCWVGVLR